MIDAVPAMAWSSLPDGSVEFLNRRWLDYTGAPLTDILLSLCDTIDAQSPEIISTAMLMDPDGKRLWPVAGHRIPKGWIEAITPLTIGANVGSCGTASSLKQRVVASDIAADPLWIDYREVALAHGLRAASSQPLLSKDQQMPGTFAMYYAEPSNPERQRPAANRGSWPRRGDRD